MIVLIYKIASIAVCGILWRIGGMAGWSKGYRRFGVPGAIMLNVLLMQNWLGLISIPLLIASFCIGYGETSKLSLLFESKYLVRLLCGLAYSLAAVPILWGNWWFMGFHIALTSAGVMLAGNQKFKLDDHREEGFIGMAVSMVPIMV